MKALLSTAGLFFIAGFCFASPQPAQQRSPSEIVDLLTSNNLNPQKTRPVPAPKIYVTQQDGQAPQGQNLPASTTPNPSTSQTFTPTPVINYYKEFR